MTRVSRAVVAGALLFAASSVCQAQSAAGSSAGAPMRAMPSPSVAPRLDSAGTGRADTFLGSDKVRHFMMSGFIEAVGFNALQAANVDRSASLGAATALTLGIGIARELHDRRTKGLFSLGDLTWDTLGTAAALLIFSHSQR